MREEAGEEGKTIEAGEGGRSGSMSGGRLVSVALINEARPNVTGAPYRKMDLKVATGPKTQSPPTIKVEIKIKFDSRIKR